MSPRERIAILRFWVATASGESLVYETGDGKTITPTHQAAIELALRGRISLVQRLRSPATPDVPGALEFVAVRRL
ncbi:MAG TPA: hypothetical protein VG248_17345 [Caulobacteraceae bacterium]|jgi:hypothetical protein|nr:hypothetical protein [Caulobacteraceae bacterium]